MTDKEFLQWIHERLNCVHSEWAHMEYMIRLQKIIDDMPDEAPQSVTPDPEIARIKQVLGTLIGWLQLDLGEANVRKLLEDLNK